MAKGRTALGIEVAGGEVRLVAVEADPAAPRVVGTQTVRLEEDLGRVLRAMPGRAASAVSAVGLRDGAIRTLTLPPTSEENLARVVALEAESVLPFAADDLALGWHVLGMNEQSQVEILLAAARQSAVRSALEPMSRTPWGTSDVTLSSIALFNAAQRLVEGAGERTVAVLRIEESESELLVMDRGRIAAAQFLPIGCGPEAPDEEGLEGTAAELPWVESLAARVRYALGSLSYERALMIERLYVCGKGGARTGADWRLSDRLEQPVGLLSPAEMNPPEGAGSMVAYGCALQAAGAARYAFNLTPPQLVVARQVEERRQTRVSWAALAVAAGLSLLLMGAALQTRQERALKEVDARLKEAKVLAVRPAVAPGKLKTALEAVDQASASRVSPAGLLRELNRELPQGAWLAELTYNAGTGCVLRGYSLDQAGARRAQVGLLQRQLFDEVMLDYLAEEQIGKSSAWSFQLTCKLRAEERRGRRRRRG